MTTTVSGMACRSSAIAASALTIAGFGAGTALANPIGGALGESKPIIDTRLRYEYVDQVPFLERANATTLRARLGFETGKAWGTSLLAEGAFVGALNDSYNSTTNGRVQYPVVADPKVGILNRLQLTNTSIANTMITLGRQRINIDDQRFVGSVDWRQNEQTFDAFRVTTKPIGNLTMDVTYSNRVNRVFGDDSTQGVYNGHLVFLNAAYPFSCGKLTAFGYLLNFENIPAVPAAIRDSSATYGVRFAGMQPVGPTKITYAASYATQRNYANNPLHFSNDYYLAEIGLAYRQWSAGAGVENLQGDGVKGFTTPLATLHKFQGWADKFLVTPVNGINDKYASAAYTTKKITPFETVGLTFVYHSFESTRLGQNFGYEDDAQLAAKWRRYTGTLKYAKYNAAASTPAAIGRNTSKFWAQLQYIW